MQVSKKAQYGLRAMVCLSKAKDKLPVPLKNISLAEGIPFEFLEKIISELEKAKLVKGKKGSGGGYVLSKKPKSITINDIFSVLEKTTIPVDCSFCGKSKKCASRNVWKKVEIAINKTLKAITLADLGK
jgi:Rrf2 family protein